MYNLTIIRTLIIVLFVLALFFILFGPQVARATYDREHHEKPFCEEVLPTPTLTPTMMPTVTPEPTQTPTPVPATATPGPTSTPQPTQTPAPQPPVPAAPPDTGRGS